jgi:formamidopyrimidine-DNA glycosylase
LHASILHICQTAVDLLADASKFPDDWLFSHRWGKGKKGAATTLPSGEKITFITVGGRTSCVVPSVQKKTGPVAAGIKIDDEDDDTITDNVKAKLKGSEDEQDTKTAVNGTGKNKRKLAAASETNDTKANSKKRAAAAAKIKDEDKEDVKEVPAKKVKRGGSKKGQEVNGTDAKSVSTTREDKGRRRSARLSTD